MSHLLKPLNVGVFKSFQSNFNKACGKYMREFPGRVITTDVLASIVAETYPMPFTPVNMSGFKMCGIWPINPSEVTDRHIAPATTLHVETKVQDSTCVSKTDKSAPEGSPLFTPEQGALYQKRYEEQYDVDDPEYIACVTNN